jgi:8-oxo-dGTP pyrophosphatase MutT (NUDIX family)
MSSSQEPRPSPLGLAFDPARAAAIPRDAATVLLLRDGDAGLEIFCVERNVRSGFLGGAVVFPGGKVDAEDAHVRASGAPRRVELVASEAEQAHALGIAAARELLEEAGVLPARADASTLATIRSRLAAGASLREMLDEHGVRLELDGLVAFARWITPEAEARRFDARFFVMALPSGQEAMHDGHETTKSFWARPEEVLSRFASSTIQLAPPTTRSLELLCAARDVAAAIALADAQRLAPICPRFVPGDPPALALPGDPEHDERETVVAGPTRFVLRDGRFVSEHPPTNVR